jgi:hypothetical protein
MPSACRTLFSAHQEVALWRQAFSFCRNRDRSGAPEWSSRFHLCFALPLYPLRVPRKIKHGAQMGTIMIRCPQTQQEISTGISIDRTTFRSMPVFFSRTFCPLCRVTHEWFAKDAWVCDPVSEPCEPVSQKRVA